MLPVLGPLTNMASLSVLIKLLTAGFVVYSLVPTCPSNSGLLLCNFTFAYIMQPCPGIMTPSQPLNWHRVAEMICHSCKLLGHAFGSLNLLLGTFVANILWTRKKEFSWAIALALTKMSFGMMNAQSASNMATSTMAALMRATMTSLEMIYLPMCAYLTDTMFPYCLILMTLPFFSLRPLPALSSRRWRSQSKIPAAAPPMGSHSIRILC